MFGGTVTPDTVLVPGVAYYFKFNIDTSWFGSPDESDLQAHLSAMMINYGTIAEVDSEFTSDDVYVTVIPTSAYKLKDWITAFNYSFGSIYPQTIYAGVSDQPKASWVQNVFKTAGQGLGEAAAGLTSGVLQGAQWLLIPLGILAAMYIMTPRR